jgi:redox-sensing transcriptional repressor
MKNKKISPYVIKRLPRYYRFLGDLMDEGETRISSMALSSLMGLTASQIRQDLNQFGGFGQQGYGYNVESLRSEIASIIGMDKVNKVIIVGAGNVGQAICDDISFEKRGCILTGIFDKSPALHGKKVTAEHKVRSMEELPEFCEKHQPSIAVLCVPKTSAEEVCEQLLECGVKCFWNFTHFDINLCHRDRDDIFVENVHLGDSLLTLVYSLNINRKL